MEKAISSFRVSKSLFIDYALYGGEYLCLMHLLIRDSENFVRLVFKNEERAISLLPSLLSTNRTGQLFNFLFKNATLLFSPEKVEKVASFGKIDRATSLAPLWAVSASRFDVYFKLRELGFTYSSNSIDHIVLHDYTLNPRLCKPPEFEEFKKILVGSLSLEDSSVVTKIGPYLIAYTAKFHPEHKLTLKGSKQSLHLATFEYLKMTYPMYDFICFSDYHRTNSRLFCYPFERKGKIPEFIEFKGYSIELIEQKMKELSSYYKFVSIEDYHPSKTVSEIMEKLKKFTES